MLFYFIVGVHSPDAVEKLLSLSEIKKNKSSVAKSSFTHSNSFVANPHSSSSPLSTATNSPRLNTNLTSSGSLMTSFNNSINANGLITKSSAQPTSTSPSNPHQQHAKSAAAVSESDSGRASMASNIDQDQYSPIFQQRNSKHYQQQKSNLHFSPFNIKKNFFFTFKLLNLH